MSIESGTEAPFYAFTIPVTGEGDGRSLTKFPYCINQRYSISVRKSYVANNDIELFPVRTATAEANELARATECPMVSIPRAIITAVSSWSSISKTFIATFRRDAPGEFPR